LDSVNRLFAILLRGGPNRRKSAVFRVEAGAISRPSRRIEASPATAGRGVLGIAAIVEQQFELADRIAQTGLLPILEPEYEITAPDRPHGEAILKRDLVTGLNRLAGDRLVMLKLSIPTKANLYRELAGHPRVARLAALSGGYSRQEACAELARNDGMIASFSRALLQDLRVKMTDEQFDLSLAEAIDEIYRASVHASA
jgi:fructose-bisphosphate aldolase class I